MQELLLRMAKLLIPQILKLQKSSYTMTGSIAQMKQMQKSREDYLNELIDVHTECLLKMEDETRKEYHKWVESHKLSYAER